MNVLPSTQQYREASAFKVKTQKKKKIKVKTHEKKKKDLWHISALEGR